MKKMKNIYSKFENISKISLFARRSKEKGDNIGKLKFVKTSIYSKMRGNLIK